MSSTIWTGVHCISSKCLLQKSFDWKLRATTRVFKKMCLQFCIGSRRSDHWPAQQVPQTHVLARYASLLPFGLKAAPELRHEKVPETLTWQCFSLFSSALSTVIPKDAILAQHSKSAKAIQSLRKFAKCRFTIFHLIRPVRCGCFKLELPGPGKTLALWTQKNISATLLTWSFVTVKSYVVDIGVWFGIAIPECLGCPLVRYSHSHKCSSSWIFDVIDLSVNGCISVCGTPTESCCLALLTRT